ncbi:hypothetical protein P3T76_009425 [Phytophthora citrophthora]|uniref:Uncharacterized protein n=1 Tax=Phytophthora citrophthora TaxID=4793 RepID=A0AAD9GGM5_9STRA|nr:hypothetical protein P3T76_009425 [Phytophthora citrophthora]
MHVEDGSAFGFRALANYFGCQKWWTISASRSESSVGPTFASCVRPARLLPVTNGDAEPNVPRWAGAALSKSYESKGECRSLGRRSDLQRLLR